MAESSEVAKHDDGVVRRDFLYLATGALGAVGAAMAIWPFVKALAPARDVLALATLDVDLSPLEPGQAITVQWQGKPVFVRARTEEDIQAARDVDVARLPDPQPDQDRVIEPEWLILVGICTHLGCIPLGQNPADPKGEFGGWFCPCHGSHYDTSGRIRRGPAPRNLEVPPYEFVDETTIRIG